MSSSSLGPAGIAAGEAVPRGSPEGRTSGLLVTGARHVTFYERRLKRVLDAVLASVALIVLAPLLASVALGVLVALGRPVLYRQERLGRGAQPFTMYKFRSMRPERTIDSRRFHTPPDDPRHTLYGRFIRRFGLDELPQLANVLRGDMSLIGPRPEIPAVAERYGIVDHPRHLVRPGITGPWQVSPFRHEFVHMHTHLDAEYVGDLTFRRDVSIAVRTLWVVVIGKRRPRPSSDTAVAPMSGAASPRVLHVLEPTTGGVPTYVDQLGRELARRGVVQYVITSAHSRHAFEWAEAVIRSPWQRCRFRDHLRVRRLVSAVVTEQRIDVVHAHATFAGVASRLARHRGVTVYQPHCWGYLSASSRPARAGARLLERLLAPRSDLLVVLSEAERRAAPPTRRVVRARPLRPLDAFGPADEPERWALRARFGWDETERVHLSMGRFTAQKNFDRLVEAFCRLAGPRDRLVLVGDGPSPPPRSKLGRGACAGRVDLVGWRNDVHLLLRAADSLLVSSRGEGFSLAMLEALLSGLPVFSTPVGGTEVIRSCDGVVAESVTTLVRAAFVSPLVPPPAESRFERAHHHRRLADPDTAVSEFLAFYRALGIPEFAEALAEDETGSPEEALEAAEARCIGATAAS